MKSPVEPTAADKFRRQGGWALVSTLWVLALLAMMAAATQALTVTSARIEHRAQDQARMNADVNAAVIRTVLALTDPRTDQRWPADGTLQSFVFDNRKMQISIHDQTGLVDINKANEATLNALLQFAGADMGTAKTLTAAIMDWREPIGDAYPDRKTGTTDGQYVAAGLDYRPRHGPFQTVDELKLVAGMTPDLFASLLPLVTVYSRTSDIDQTVAPAAVLTLMANAAKAVQPSAANAPGQPVPSSPAASATPPPANDGPGFARVAGRSFAVTITAVDGTRNVVRTIVVEPTGDNQRPYLVEAWQ